MAETGEDSLAAQPKPVNYTKVPISIYGASPAAELLPSDTKNEPPNDLDHSGVHQALAGFKSAGLMASDSFRTVSLMDNRTSKGQKVVVLLLNIILPIVATVIGGIFKDQCPLEPMIPIWCIVTGSIAVISCLIELLIILRGEHYQKGPCIIHIFLPIWFIVGGVYTYRNYEPLYMAPIAGTIYAKQYCNIILYQFTFWYITAYFAVIFLTIFCCCCCSCLAITGLLASINLDNKC